MDSQIKRKYSHLLAKLTNSKYDFVLIKCTNIFIRFIRKFASKIEMNFIDII